MNHAMIAIAIFAVTLASSLFLVSRTIHVARQMRLMHEPGELRVHKTAVPRLAGPAIMLAFLIGIAVSFFFNITRFTIEIERLILLIVGCTFVAITIVYDDLIGIAPKPKLLLQVTAALIVVLPRLRGERHGIVIEQFNIPFGDVVTLPLVIAIAFTIFWIVGMMNTMNWIDGLDGLAGTVTVVACIILFIHTFFWPRDDPQFTISILPLALGAAVLGFLFFNWYPAKIIMGDSGAMFLGFALAIISIIGGAKIAAALLALGLPILDVAWVILVRLIRRRSPGTRDMGHLHHRLLELGWSQPRIDITIGGVSLAFGLLALLLPSRELKLIAIGGMGLIVLASVVALAVRTPQNEESGPPA
jgi:UDP-N-acetylmuramyl pentapeptide phosphotransferase/UDP-N-acetylglucosamine-1-phosphate transferase